jgi:MFS family permease
MTLDLGGDYAGSVSAVMNTSGNIGAAVAAALTGYLATRFGWNSAFLVLAGLALIAAGVCSQIDASRKFSLSAPPLPAAPLSTS